MLVPAACPAQAVESNPDLSTLAAVLRAASLGRPWNATGYGGTVLAPTSESHACMSTSVLLQRAYIVLGIPEL